MKVKFINFIRMSKWSGKLSLVNKKTIEGSIVLKLQLTSDDRLLDSPYRLSCFPSLDKGRSRHWILGHSNLNSEHPSN